MIVDDKGKKWSNRDLLEKAAMQETLINKLKDRISKYETEIAEITKCHVEAEKELLDREKLVEKLQENLQDKLSAGGGESTGE